MNKRNKKIKMIKQKIFSLSVILLSLPTIKILDGDASFVVLFILPVMGYMFFSKHYWLLDN